MKFDVILPTIGRDSLRNTIQSVVDQTYTNWSLHVVFDRYEIPIDEFIEWSNRWPYDIRTLYVESVGNDQGAFARNAGIKFSNNEWIAYIDDDDIWHPHHLETHARIIQENPGVDMVRTAGQSFSMRHKSPRSSKLIMKPGHVNTTDILTVGMSHSRELFNKSSGWQTKDNHDHLLWNEMLSLGGVPVVRDESTFLFKR